MKRTTIHIFAALALLLGLTVLPTLAYWIFSLRQPRQLVMRLFHKRKLKTIRIGSWEIRYNYVETLR